MTERELWKEQDRLKREMETRYAHYVVEKCTRITASNKSSNGPLTFYLFIGSKKVKLNRVLHSIVEKAVNEKSKEILGEIKRIMAEGGK